MNTSIEISYYPLHNEFIPHIQDFIFRMNQYQNIEVVTNGMSTQVFGDYDDVMAAISCEIKNSFSLPHSVFILKIVNANLNHKDGSN